MASPEIDAILSCSKKLATSIASGEYKIEEMVRHGNAILGKGQCIRDFQYFLQSVNEVTKNGQKRAVLLDELQKENKLIMAYHEQNRILKDAVEDCFNTIDTVMIKHKETMNKVRNIDRSAVSHDEIWSLLLMEDSPTPRSKLTEIANDLTSHIQKGEEECNNFTEKVSQLQHEHAVLREMLATSEISNPGIQNIFYKVFNEIKRRRTNSSDNSESETLNDTIIEAKPSLNSTVIEVSQDAS